MGSAQWLLELVLLLMLAATLFHALRLEKALGVLKRDRAVLEDLVEGFNNSTRQAESGIERLRAAADGAGRQMMRQIEEAQRLRDDLSFLTERSDKLAERLESAVRQARMLPEAAPVLPFMSPLPMEDAPPHGGARPILLPQPLMPPPAPMRPEGRPDLRHEMRQESLPARGPMAGLAMLVNEAANHQEPAPENEAPTRLRSQAERDLLRALRASR